MPYGGGYNDLSTKNNKLNRYSFIKNSRKGAILIEFAFAVPVLFSLIYYVHDLATIKRWNSKLDFSLYCAANMFQNTQNITKTDFKRIANASFIGMYHEHSEWLSTYPHPLMFKVLCITGVKNNNCRVNWFAWSAVSIKDSYSVTNLGLPGAYSSRFRVKNIQVGSTYAATQLDPLLSIAEGETKIILEISIYNGLNKDSFHKDYLRLFVAKVTPVFYVNKEATIMNHIIIFTPKPGTFDPNNPPQ